MNKDLSKVCLSALSFSDILPYVIFIANLGGKVEQKLKSFETEVSDSRQLLL